jgi:hypothetical protein
VTDIKSHSAPLRRPRWRLQAATISIRMLSSRAMRSRAKRVASSISTTRVRAATPGARHSGGRKMKPPESDEQPGAPQGCPAPTQRESPMNLSRRPYVCEPPRGKDSPAGSLESPLKALGVAVARLFGAGLKRWAPDHSRGGWGWRSVGGEISPHPVSVGLWRRRARGGSGQGVNGALA